MKSVLDKILDYVEGTGDKCIVVDRHSQSAYVIFSFDDYERLLKDSAGVAHLTQEELLDRINREIAVWKSSQNEEEDYSDIQPFSSISDVKPLKEKIHDEEFYESIKPKGFNTIIQGEQEEIENEEEGEEGTKFYFEPIE